MKTLLSIIIAGIFLLAGCSDKDYLVTPENSIKSEPNWITLPLRSDLSVETEYSVTGQINGYTGGKLEINKIYFSGNSVVRLNVKLRFPMNSFQGTENITMIVDNVNGTITYSPHMNFDVPAILDVQFQGIDLTGINSNNIDFVYYNPNGYYDSIEYDRIIVDHNSGKLELKDGRIPHFSRYGFCR